MLLFRPPRPAGARPGHLSPFARDSEDGGEGADDVRAPLRRGRTDSFSGSA